VQSFKDVEAKLDDLKVETQNNGMMITPRKLKR
jgi:hypothetical protein